MSGEGAGLTQKGFTCCRRAHKNPMLPLGSSRKGMDNSFSTAQTGKSLSHYCKPLQVLYGYQAWAACLRTTSNEGTGMAILEGVFPHLPIRHLSEKLEVWDPCHGFQQSTFSHGSVPTALSWHRVQGKQRFVPTPNLWRIRGFTHSPGPAQKCAVLLL